MSTLTNVEFTLIIFSVSRGVSSAEEEEEEGNVPPKKKKKKSEKKRKKKKKHKKKSGRRSDSSGSDSETIYPSDLKREEKADGYRHTLLHHLYLHFKLCTQVLAYISSVVMVGVCGVVQGPGCSASKSLLLVG